MMPYVYANRIYAGLALQDPIPSNLWYPLKRTVNE